MFEASSMMFIYVETPLHAGTGRGLGGVDLPIQRERVTGYPIVQASSLKGRLRAEGRKKSKESPTEEERKQGWLSTAEFEAIFGPETERASEHAGALSPGDAKILLFPVRSLAGVFAWTTSCDVLARFLRDTEIVGLRPEWNVPPEPASGEVLIFGTELLARDGVVLEEFTFSHQQSDEIQEIVQNIGKWLAQNALPEGDEYRYWREALPNRLAILPRDAFRDFTVFSTEVITRVRLEPETKTVAEGALWTEEHLPVDTLLYAPLMATPTRAKNGIQLSGAEVLARVSSLGLTRTVLGGDETVGRGVVALRFVTGGAS
ncbi:MAG: type III-B CRISPR module RAMP protein Cmr4 [Anaerolineae bacterium]|nr:type III-B CRISPR module RAMP protein Cmr4 [Anaerolineae bacterium]MDW8099258.1 type III-B CRISPR module RAMP protein Cmr4 [Anaerolineae bacterium]